MPAPIRCAIYTRKSSEEGLEQNYNSLDAQRDACAAYVLSQAGEGWTLLPQPYDDGGYSGGTMERPALQRLLAEIEARRVDVVVVYKVDRLTRALADFARIVEIMDHHGASFVSVTQAFNTTTSMGRLTLNVLLSFAQFEREVTGERIRDKIAASKRKGMWMGGIVPLGYRPAGRTLDVVEAEADLVQHIFHRYRELGSVHLLRDALQAEGVVSKRRVSRSGREFGGTPFGRGALYHLLRNPIYLGEIRHKSATYPGQHPAIIDRALFDAVQRSLDENTVKTTAGSKAGASSDKTPLQGIVFDGNGERMSPVSAHKNGGATYRYYVSQALQTGRQNAIGQNLRVNAGLLEAFVYDRLARLDLVPSGPDWNSARSLLQRVEVDTTQLRMMLTAHPKLLALASDATALRARLGEAAAFTLAAEAITLSCPMVFTRRSGRTGAFGPAGRETVVQVERDAALTSALIRAEAWKRRLMFGKTESLATIARAEGVTPAYIARMIRLAFLAPSLKRQILEGRQPGGLTLQRLMTTPIPLAWSVQQALYRA